MISILHKIIGDHISNFNLLDDCKIIKDPKCNGTQNIPLFCKINKSNDTEYCNVDILLIRKGEIKVIIEIEESFGLVLLLYTQERELFSDTPE